jgi:hypothetical protein
LPDDGGDGGERLPTEEAREQKPLVMASVPVEVHDERGRSVVGATESDAFDV